MSSTHSTYKEASEYAKKLAKKEGKTVSLKRDGNAWIVKVEGKTEEHVPNNESSNVWVGKFAGTGAIVVFDSSIKVEGVDKLYGYVPARDLMRKFEPNEKEVTQVVNGEDKDAAVSKYMAWKKLYAKSFIASEVEHLENMKRGAIQKHKDYLLKIGKEYSGVNMRSSKRHRATHCYACRVSLSSDFHIECNTCSWLICECGACGCGYGN